MSLVERNYHEEEETVAKRKASPEIKAFVGGLICLGSLAAGCILVALHYAGPFWFVVFIMVIAGLGNF